MSSPQEFKQLALKFIDSLQYDYEVIRPVVLFAERIAERSRETGIDRTVVGDKARRFVEKGMLGLADQRAEKAGRRGHEYPEPVAAHILYLKQIYPPIHYREIVRIIGRKFGYTTNHHTVKHFLEQHPIPVQLELDFTPFHDFEDAYQARWTVVRMWYEGWNKKSIAGCLQLSRKHVHAIINAFEQDEFAGLEDERTRPADHPANQMSLPFLKEVLDLQHEYPRAGRFRIRGLLDAQGEQDPPSERTVGRAMAINREFHDAPGSWQGPDTGSDETPKHMPYRALYRHHLWFIDLRYLVKVDGSWVYSICVLEGYSRMILAGAASEYQDLTAVLQVLFAALSAYGCPSALVSDNGSVFQAHDYTTILERLEVEPIYIEKGKPWQNLIEAQFKVQLRLADDKFERAETFDEVQSYHAGFVETFNTTPHWGHQNRDDDRRTPAEVLDWIKGRQVDVDTLRRAFLQTQFTRTVNQRGYVSVQRFYIYAERGLSRQRVSIWIHDGQLRIEHEETVLAEYHADYDRRQKRLGAVSQPTLHQTAFVSPQLELFELDDDQWLKIHRRMYHRRKQRVARLGEQLPLTGLQVSMLLLCFRVAEKVGENFFPNV